MIIYEVSNRDGFYTYRIGEDDRLRTTEGWKYRKVRVAESLEEAEWILSEMILFEERVVGTAFFFR